MDFVITILLYTFVIVFDLYPLFKKRNVKTSWVYLITILLTFSILILHSINIFVPSPNTLIKGIINSIL